MTDGKTRGISRILLLAAVAVATACGSTHDPDRTQAARRKSPYFDMAGLMAKLEKNARGHSFRKVAVLGDKFEEGVSGSPDYHRELAVFYAADITKPAWEGQFSIVPKGLVTTYAAQDDKPDLRLLVVEKDEKGRPVQVAVSLVQHNYLYSSDASGSLYVRYEHDTVPMLDSVNLSGEQKIVFGSPFTYVLRGKTL